MTQVGSGEVAVFPTFKGFRAEIVTQTDSAGNEGGNVFTRAFTGAAKGLAAGVAVGFGAAFAGAAAIGAKGLDRALNIQDARQKLLSLGNDAGSVDEIMKNALASVKGTAFGLGDAAGVAASAVAAGIAPGEALTRTLTATANAAAIAGVPLNEMGSIINKVATNGKLTTEVLQQFQDRGVPLLQAVANEYGVTAEEAQKMVTEGKVNFADFQTALEKSVGEGAVGAGKTARGAFNNIGAAFSRLGAMFVQPAVDGAPTLFGQIANAVDRATTAAKPLSDWFGAKVTAAMTAAGTAVDGINFDSVVAKITAVGQGISGIYSLIVNGDFTSEFASAFNVTEDSPVVNVILTIRDGITGLFALLVNGDFTGAFARAFNVDEDSPVIDFLLNARQAVIDFFASIGQAFATGDFSQIGESFGAIGTALNPLFPIFLQVGQGIGQIAGNIGGLIAAGLPLLAPIIDTFTGALGFLSDNAGLIPPIITAIVVAVAAYRLAQSAANVAELGALPIRAANVAALFAQASANRALATQMAISNGQQVASRAAMLPATAQVLLNTGAMIGNAVAAAAVRVAQLAGAVALGIATAAQWAWNAAMSANPIGIIIIAIAALVAGLIWFFTQTELGQDIWANFTKFLGEAWNNIVAVVQAAIAIVLDVITNVVNFIVTVWTTYWNIVFTVIGAVWGFIVAVVTTYINIVVTIITSIVSFIVTVWTTYWNIVFTVISTIWNAIVTVVMVALAGLGGAITAVVDFIVGAWTAFWNLIFSVIETVWGAIVSFVAAYIQTMQAIITNVVNTISSVWNSTWSAISGFFQSIWDGIVSFIASAVSGVQSAVSGLVSGVTSTVQGVFDFIGSIPGTILNLIGNLGNLLVDSGKSLIQGFIDGITGMISSVGDAIGGVMDFVGGFFPHSPAERGEFSGSGWTRLKASGGALLSQFTSGFEGDDPFGSFPFDPGTGGRGPGTPGVAGTGGGGVMHIHLEVNGKEIASAIREFDRSLK